MIGDTHDMIDIMFLIFRRKISMRHVFWTEKLLFVLY